MPNTKPVTPLNRQSQEWINKALAEMGESFRVQSTLTKTVSHDSGPEPFASFLFPQVEAKPWFHAPHLDLLSQRLSELADPDSPLRRLIVSCPPRHGKSELCSVYFPLWVLKRWLRAHVILASYGADLSKRFCRKVRNIIRDHAFLGMVFAADSASQMDWELREGGGMVASGVGGPIGGRGGNFLIMDDPYKNREDANSAAYRSMVWDWWRSTFIPRAEPNASVLLIMTRWREDDLAGTILKEQPQLWEHLRLPALSEGKEDPLERPEGDALWPERFDKTSLLGIKTEIGDRFFSGEYQQAPTPEGGTIFKRQWFRYFYLNDGRLVLEEADGTSRSFLLEDCAVFQTCDPAGTTKAHADYFALLTWGITPVSNRRLLLLDIVQVHAETVDHLKIMKQQRRRWDPEAQYVEKEKYGLAMMQQARVEGHPLLPLYPHKDKVARSWGLENLYRNDMVFHRRGIPKLEAYESEILSFPEAAHDDMADTGFYAALVFQGRTGKRGRPLQRKGRVLRTY